MLTHHLFNTHLYIPIVPFAAGIGTNGLLHYVQFTPNYPRGVLDYQLVGTHLDY